MKRILLLALALCMTVFWATQSASPSSANVSSEIVGAWYVDTVGAPFVPHGIIFHADRTLVLTNPDAAEAQNSSSSGYGAWRQSRRTVTGRFFEVNADKTTNQFTTLLVVTFTVTVHGDTFTGPASASYYDGEQNLVAGPFPATLEGQRFEVTGPVPDPLP